MVEVKSQAQRSLQARFWHDGCTAQPLHTPEKPMPRRVSQLNSLIGGLTLIPALAFASALRPSVFPLARLLKSSTAASTSAATSPDTVL